MELEATWWRTAQVWWAVSWRWTLAGAIGGVIVGAITSPDIGAIFWFGVGLPFFRWMLNRDFGDFRLAVVPKREGGPVTTGASSSDPWQ